MLIGSDQFKIIKDSLPLEVRLLAVSKGHSQASIRKLSGYGQLDFGESRLQEAVPKKNELNDLKQLRWHFVGTLQKNKVRGVIREFDFIRIWILMRPLNHTPHCQPSYDRNVKTKSTLTA